VASSEKQTIDLELSLKSWFSDVKRVVVAGIGNPFRRDDLVGLEIVRNLQSNVSKYVYLIEADTIPESYIPQIISFKPTHILLVDAGIINKEPGTAQLSDSSQLLRKTPISTHALPLRIFCDYLTETTAAKIALLIIQPNDVSFGETLTPALKKAATKLSKILQKFLP
jgi:hydrogenase 3 maturation protease